MLKAFFHKRDQESAAKANAKRNLIHLAQGILNGVSGTTMKGNKGSIHSTDGHYGKGHTTLHPDGSSHHHGTRAHVGGKANKDGGQSYTRDGKMSRK